MNAGAFGADIASVLVGVSLLLRDGSINDFPAQSLELGYRTSALKEGRLAATILDARIALAVSNPDDCRRAVEAIGIQRLERFPQGASSGCIFRNPPKGPTAGELLDLAGCKSMHQGKARVSRIHANFIVNDGQDNARDILALIERMAQRVLQVHGQHLELEVILPCAGDSPQGWGLSPSQASRSRKSK